VASSYVTGSHSLKVGFEAQRGHFWRGDNNDSTGGIWYTFTNGAPAFVNLNAPATGWQDNLDANIGIFVQDRWTIDRLTLSGGLRWDYLNTSTEPFTLGPHRWLPNRNVFDEVENVPAEGHPARIGGLRPVRRRQTAVKASASRREQHRWRRATEQPGEHGRHHHQRAWADANNSYPTTTW
jgi:hypothetical protein